MSARPISTKNVRHCPSCGQDTPLMAAFLGICPGCAWDGAGLSQAREAHRRSRGLFDLPQTPPRTAGGRRCALCACECLIGEGERGFCGLRKVENGRLKHQGGTAGRGILHWYRDPLPTNCVAGWVCPGSHQYGKHNLAVFYKSCTLDCLFCHNWHFRETDLGEERGLTASELAGCATTGTFCVCFFGGDPASQMPHALAAANELAAQGVAICWETAGTANRRLMDRAVQYSLESGGCVKFDIKAFTEPLHIALTGWSNSRTLDNFFRAAQRFQERPQPPLVIASTLLVPGYVDVDEVRRIATFIASVDPRIPYSLLGFGPNYLMPDLPPTSIEHAQGALQVAVDAGLENVHIGNRHLLGLVH